MPLIIANKGERIYIDANVLVYYFYTKHRPDFSRKATELLEKIENDYFEGVISSLAIMELVKSMRELLIKFGKIYDIKEVEKIVHEAIKAIFSFDHVCFVEGRPADFEPAVEIEKLQYHEVSNECLKLIMDYCGKTDYDAEESQNVHRGLHAPDFYHLVLAKKLHCDKIATFEWGFQETNKEIIPLILQDRNSIW